MRRSGPGPLQSEVRRSPLSAFGKILTRWKSQVPILCRPVDSYLGGAARNEGTGSHAESESRAASIDVTLEGHHSTARRGCPINELVSSLTTARSLGSGIGSPRCHVVDRSGLFACLQRFVRGENAAGQRRRLRPQVEGLEHLELLSAGRNRLGNMMCTPSPVVEIDAKRSPHVAKLATWNYLAAALEARLAHVLQCIN